MALPSIEDRVNALRNETTRAKLIAEGIEAGDMKNLAHMLHPFGIDSTPNLDFARQQSLLQLAEAEGKDPVEVYVERLLASEGREFFNFWMFGGNLDNQWKYMQLPHVVPMLGDAGAPRWLLHRHRSAHGIAQRADPRTGRLLAAGSGASYYRQVCSHYRFERTW